MTAVEASAAEQVGRGSGDPGGARTVEKPGKFSVRSLVRERDAGDGQRLAAEIADWPAAAWEAGPELLYRKPGLEHQQLMRWSTCLRLPAGEHKAGDQKLIRCGIGPVVPDRTHREVDRLVIFLIRQIGQTRARAVRVKERVIGRERHGAVDLFDGVAAIAGPAMRARIPQPRAGAVR